MRCSSVEAWLIAFSVYWPAKYKAPAANITQKIANTIAAFATRRYRVSSAKISASPTPIHGPRDWVISNPATMAASAKPRSVKGRPWMRRREPQLRSALRNQRQYTSPMRKIMPARMAWP